MNLIKSILISLTLFAFSNASIAVPVNFGDGGSSLQGLLDSITMGPEAGSSSLDVTTDYLRHDREWVLTGSGGSFARMIFESTGDHNHNVFGIYDVHDPDNYVVLFNGSDGAGDRALLEIWLDGSVWINFTDTGIDFSGKRFGYYLDSNPNQEGGIYYSQEALNPGQVDPLVAYQGNGIDQVQLHPNLHSGTWAENEFILAWEDYYGDGGGDYTDFIVMVESVENVPEPSTVMLVALGLLGLGRARRNARFA